MTRVLRFVFWSVVLWTGLGLFFATQLVLFGAPWGRAVAFSMPRWYSWGLLTPVVFWADHRLGGGRSLAARVALHVPLGLGCTSLAIVLRLVTRPLRGSPMPPSVAA